MELLAVSQQIEDAVLSCASFWRRSCRNLPSALYNLRRLSKSRTFRSPLSFFGDAPLGTSQARFITTGLGGAFPNISANDAILGSCLVPYPLARGNKLSAWAIDSGVGISKPQLLRSARTSGLAFQHFPTVKNTKLIRTPSKGSTQCARLPSNNRKADLTWKYTDSCS